MVHTLALEIPLLELPSFDVRYLYCNSIICYYSVFSRFHFQIKIYITMKMHSIHNTMWLALATVRQDNQILVSIYTRYQQLRQCLLRMIFFLLLQTIGIILYNSAKTGSIMSLPVKIAIGVAIGVAVLTVVLVPSLYFGLRGMRFDCIEKQVFIIIIIFKDSSLQNKLPLEYQRYTFPFWKSD